MKIYKKIVINIATGETVAEESFDYNGKIAELQGPDDFSLQDELVRHLVGQLKAGVPQDMNMSMLANSPTGFEFPYLNLSIQASSEGLVGSFAFLGRVEFAAEED